MAMLTQDDLDKLPLGSTVWLVNTRHWKVHARTNTAIQLTEKYMYFMDRSEAEKHLEVYLIINKLRGE